MKDGEEAKAPNDPTRSGYNFAGWDAEFGSVKSDLTVNATWKEKPKTYSTGTYKVGKDIPAGEYCITSTSSTTSAYYCVYPDASKSDILNNDNFTGRAYVTVSEGQLLEISRASFISAEDAQPNAAIDKEPGTYKVGFARDTTQYTTARIPKRASCKTTTSRGRTTFKSPTASIFCSVGAQARLNSVPAIPRERISLHPGSKAPPRSPNGKVSSPHERRSCSGGTTFGPHSPKTAQERSGEAA